jgi:hypothetical protein
MREGHTEHSVLAIASLLIGILSVSMFTPLGSRLLPNGLGSVWVAVLVPFAAVASGITAFVQMRKSRPSGMSRAFARVGVALGFAVLAFVVAILGMRMRLVQHYSICGQNIKHIEDAAARAGQDQRYYDEPDNQMKMLLKQLPEKRLPVCPGGGEYHISMPGGHTHCSKHGDRVTCNQGI